MDNYLPGGWTEASVVEARVLSLCQGCHAIGHLVNDLTIGRNMVIHAWSTFHNSMLDKAGLNVTNRLRML